MRGGSLSGKGQEILLVGILTWLFNSELIYMFPCSLVSLSTK